MLDDPREKGFSGPEEFLGPFLLIVIALVCAFVYFA